MSFDPEKKPQQAIDLQLSRQFFELEETDVKAVGKGRNYGQQVTFIFERVLIPQDGGIFVKYKDCLYPKRGFPTPESTWAMDMVKKYMMTLLMTLAKREAVLPMIGLALTPRRWKLKLAEDALFRFKEYGNYCMNSQFLKNRYLTSFARAVIIFTEIFFKELGISENVSRETARILGHIFEYDDAYRYRVQDVMCETTREEFLSSPIRTIRKLVKVNDAREKMLIQYKFKAVSLLVGLSLLIPRVRKAFKKALAAVKFEDLQMDESDVYFTLLREQYDWQGLTVDERVQKWYDIHNGNCPEQVTVCDVSS